MPTHQPFLSSVGESIGTAHGAPPAARPFTQFTRDSNTTDYPAQAGGPMETVETQCPGHAVKRQNTQCHRSRSQAMLMHSWEEKCIICEVG